MKCRDGCGVLFVASDGRVVFEPDGLCPEGAIRDRVEGLHWKRALGWLLGENRAPEQLPEKPTRYPAAGENGESFQVHAAPLPPDAKYRHVIFVGDKPALDCATHRLCTLGMLAAGAAHEMNNLLTLVSGWASLAADENTADDTREGYLHRVAEASTQLSGFAQSLLDLARGREECGDPVKINKMCRSAVDLVDYQMEKAGIELEVQLSDEEPVVRGSACELTQILLNLMVNARQAMPEGGSLTLTSEVENGSAVVRVTDTGAGIEPEVRDRLFDPFVTTREGEGGTGIGLAVCKQIVEKHSGELTLEDAPEGGTTATVRIPAMAGGTNGAGG